jgi:hypothetical protein
MTVLSPKPPAEEQDDNPGPGVDALHGLKVGIRRDEIWASWDAVSREWAHMFESAGAQVSFWRAGGRTGSAGEQTEAELDGFLDGIDLAVVGLGN